MGVRKKKDYYKRIQRFRIIDDDFMRVVLKDKACTQQVLEVILEKPDLQVCFQDCYTVMTVVKNYIMVLPTITKESKLFSFVHHSAEIQVLARHTILERK